MLPAKIIEIAHKNKATHVQRGVPHAAALPLPTVQHIDKVAS